MSHGMSNDPERETHTQADKTVFHHVSTQPARSCDGCGALLIPTTGGALPISEAICTVLSPQLRGTGAYWGRWGWVAQQWIRFHL